MCLFILRIGVCFCVCLCTLIWHTGPVSPALGSGRDLARILGLQPLPFLPPPSLSFSPPLSPTASSSSFPPSIHTPEQISLPEPCSMSGEKKQRADWTFTQPLSLFLLVSGSPVALLCFHMTVIWQCYGSYYNMPHKRGWTHGLCRALAIHRFWEQLTEALSIFCRQSLG